MKGKFLTLSLTLFLFISYGQDSLYLKRGAVKIDRQDSLGDDIYNLISGYQLLMVGEMHGSNEPARLVESVADLLTRKGSNVQIGMEIPPGQMKEFLLSPTYNNIFSSYFFQTNVMIAELLLPGYI